MRPRVLFFFLIFLAVLDASARTGPTHCQYSPYFQDSVTLKTDIADGQLRIEKEASFKVYLKTTLHVPFFDAKLEVLSDQFDATVTPSPTWKDYPDVAPAEAGGGKEYFTVTLKRKSGVPDGKYDISFKLYSSRQTFPRLAFFAPLIETVDAHSIPEVAHFKMDGKALPEKWGNSAVVKDFWAFKQGSYDGKQKLAGLAPYSPSAQTRIRLVGDRDNVFLLAHLYSGGKDDTLKIYVAPEIESKPTVITLDPASSKIVSEPPVAGLKCVKSEAESAPGVAAYEIQIPRKALGIDKKNWFFMNFSRTTPGSPPSPPEKNDLTDYAVEPSFWRGNSLSVEDPVVYGKMVLGGGK